MFWESHKNNAILPLPLQQWGEWCWVYLADCLYLQQINYSNFLSFQFDGEGLREISPQSQGTVRTIDYDYSSVQ